MSHEGKYVDSAARLARYAKALGHPARVAILRFLAAQEHCFFGGIHEVLPIAKATVSQHLKELKEAGLIRGEILPPKVRYCIDRVHWEEARKLFADFFHDEDNAAAPSDDRSGSGPADSGGDETCCG